MCEIRHLRPLREIPPCLLTYTRKISHFTAQAAHNNTIRCLIHHLDGVCSIEQLEKLEIPTGTPLVYTLDEDLKPVGPRDPQTGCRGRFLDIPEDALAAARVDPFDKPVDVDFISSQDIQDECERLGLALPRELGGSGS